MALYSFDTSSILNGRRDLFRPTVFVRLWEQIEDGIASGIIRAVDEVKNELSRRDDDAKRWADRQSGLYVPIEVDVQNATTAILRAHPDLVRAGGKRSGGDPFVIALAMARNGVVVSEETRSGNLSKPRIPDVCDSLGVPVLNLMGFIESQRWTF